MGALGEEFELMSYSRNFSMFVSAISTSAHPFSNGTPALKAPELPQTLYPYPTSRLPQSRIVIHLLTHPPTHPTVSAAPSPPPKTNPQQTSTTNKDPHVG
jgi:hypothetical protein